jgi:hypothetical protein
MARFYATFDNLDVTALGDAYYQRKAFTNGTTLRNALISARSALSSAVYGKLDAVNRNGAAGVYWPVGSFSIGGGNLSWTTISKTSGAEWPSDPSVRPTAPLTGGTTVSDGGSVESSLYTDCTTALGNAFAGIADGGPYARLGVNAWRTLASIWHDHALTYFAWDDFTPGQPGSVAINVSTTQVIVSWPVSNNYEFPADVLANVSVSYVGTINGVSVSGSGTGAPGASQVAINHNQSVSNGQAFDLTATVTFSYTSPFAASGTPNSATVSGTIGSV